MFEILVNLIFFYYLSMCFCSLFYIDVDFCILKAYTNNTKTVACKTTCTVAQGPSINTVFDSRSNCQGYVHPNERLSLSVTNPTEIAISPQ